MLFYLLSFDHYVIFASQKKKQKNKMLQTKHFVTTNNNKKKKLCRSFCLLFSHLTTSSNIFVTQPKSCSVFMISPSKKRNWKLYKVFPHQKFYFLPPKKTFSWKTLRSVCPHLFVFCKEWAHFHNCELFHFFHIFLCVRLFKFLKAAK